MGNDQVNWYTPEILEENYRASISMYKFIERDFKECLEYVALSQDHLRVYSHRFANLMLRIGPEILRLFNLILFNPRRTAHLDYDHEIKPFLIHLQKDCQNRTDNIMDYFTAIRNVRIGGLDHVGVRVKDLEKYIIPFKTERRPRIRRSGKRRFCSVIPWWEDGYNALRHRATIEFKWSATFENVLFSLAGVWVLHDGYLGFDWGFSLDSDLFEKCTDRSRIETNDLPILEYICQH
ncbi:hypothetical protein MUP77_14265 [Candidatus Bathyarchaeota archaeon]|nr:hypothetical protein [Candidatus Bathyarchaeota archaeon]